MLSSKAAGFGVPTSNRAIWDRIAAQPGMQSLPRSANQLVRAGLPDQSDDLYLDFSRTGNRERFQRVAAVRRGRIATLTLAECVENKGRFIKPLEETIQSICAERTWVLPAHDRDLKSFNGKGTVIDLGSTMLSCDLATADWLLQDKLSPATRQLIRSNLASRIFAPVHDMLAGRMKPEFWFTATHNWNAVCLAGVTASAMAVLDERGERAWFAAMAEENIKSFLSGFTPDGYCSEGLGYWNYGFGHFVMLGEALRQATGGKVDLLSQPAARMPAQFGFRSEILSNIYPSIADCAPGSQPEEKIMHYLCARFQINAPRWQKVNLVVPGGSLCFNALWMFLPEPLPAVAGSEITQPGLRTWFQDGGVLICRPMPGTKDFAACLKGGNNAEHHNHNDVGSFSVVCGKTTLICDPGAEVYTGRTFSAKRYESKVLSSFGHDVPVISGKLQSSGPRARGIVKQTGFSDACDVLDLDIRSAYNVAELRKLDRRFSYRRGSSPALEVHDAAEFSRPTSFETALITWSKWIRRSTNELQIGMANDAVVVTIETSGVPFELNEEVIHEDVHTPELPHRIAIRLKDPVLKANVVITIKPSKS